MKLARILQPTEPRPPAAQRASLELGSLVFRSWLAHCSLVDCSRCTRGSLVVHSWFALGSLVVPSWFARGSLMVRSWFTQCSLVDRSWFPHGGLLVVPSWFPHGGLLVVPSWFPHGSLMVPSWWFARGSLMVHLWYAPGSLTVRRKFALSNVAVCFTYGVGMVLLWCGTLNLFLSSTVHQSSRTNLADGSDGGSRERGTVTDVQCLQVRTPLSQQLNTAIHQLRELNTHNTSTSSIIASE